MILESVAGMLRADPDAPLTMARAAEAVGATPMSLYRYFEDRDDLLVSVTRHVLRDADAAVPAGSDWQERIRAWMTTVYERSVRHPQVFQMAASGESPAWLTCSARLSEIFESAGWTDPRRVAAAVYLIGTTTLGQAMVAAASGRRLSAHRLDGAIGHLTPEEAGRVAPLIPHLVAVADAGFDLVVEATVTALASLTFLDAVTAPSAPAARGPGERSTA